MSGHVMTWGDNAIGQLGEDGATARATATPVLTLDGAITVAAGNGHALAVLEDGTVWAWGRNSFGQLGDGTQADRREPVQVTGLYDAVAAVAGGGHSMALCGDGTVWAWGAGFFGQLGPSERMFELTPVRINLDDVVTICASGAHNLAQRSDGTVWSWGRDDRGQLGDAGRDLPGRVQLGFQDHTYWARAIPAPVAGLADIVAIGSGAGHSMAIGSDGTLHVWGLNDLGQLGDGTNESTPAPRAAVLPVPARAASGGHRHSAVVLIDGSVWCCGLNDGGQVGDGTAEHRSVWTRVADIDDAVAVSANGGGTDSVPGGGGHTLAARADGTVVGWGYNDFGQLGPEPVDRHLLPVTIPGVAGCTAVAVGGELPAANSYGAKPFGGFSAALVMDPA